MLAGELVNNLIRAGVRDKVTVIIAESVRAAQLFANNSLDFVFIDGDHAEEAVVLDINTWWPKLKKGSMLAGHDFATGVGGVRQALDRCLAGKYRVDEPSYCWYVIKD